MRRLLILPLAPLLGLGCTDFLDAFGDGAALDTPADAGWYEGYWLDGDPYEGFEPQGSSPDKRLSVENDAAVLAQRVTPLDTPLLLEGPARDDSLTFTLVARIEPPQTPGHSYEDYGTCDADAPFTHVGSFPLDAVEVSAAGDLVVASWHEQGSILAGGLDSLDVRDPRNPAVLSELTFAHFDLVGATFVPDAGGADGTVWAVGQTCDPCYEPYSALAERLELASGRFTWDEDGRFGLPGTAGTSLIATPTRMFGTTGSTGGLTAFDAQAGVRLAHVELGDTRWVDEDAGLVAALTGGASTALHVFDAATMSPVRTIPFVGAQTPLAKNTVVLDGGRAWVAAGPSGLKVFELATGDEQLHVPLPPSDMDPSDVSTNAVSMDGDLVFLANGGLGITVARALVPAGSELAPSLEILGSLDVAGSVNQILYRDGVLYVAAGTEGLLIVEVGGV